MYQDGVLIQETQTKIEGDWALERDYCSMAALLKETIKMTE